MAYTSHMNDTQHPSSLPYNTRLCLFGGNLACDWEELCLQENTMTSLSSHGKTTMLGLQPVITRQIQTLASLESNYETSEEELMEEERGEIDQVGGELVDEDEMEDDFDAEEDDDDDYVEFCSLLSKSPAHDAAASRFIHTSFATAAFSFTLTKDEDSSDDNDTGDDRDCSSENDSDEDEVDWSVPQSTCFGGFDPFAVSGLFMPSLLSTIASCPLSDPSEKSCSSNNDYSNNEDEGKELIQKLKDINRRWFEVYSDSDDDIPTMVDDENGITSKAIVDENCITSKAVVDENCITSKAFRVTCKKNVHFCDKTMFIDILNKEEWAEDYEGARKGPWEQFYRDHLRFESRIESMRELLSNVLVAEHRATVFQRLYETAELVTNDQNSLIDLFHVLPASS